MSMKYLIALMLLAPITSQAELIQHNDRDIYDLIWLPRQGTVFGSTEVGFEDREYEIRGNGNPGKINEGERKLIQRLGYSISDRFVLSFETDYLFRRKITFTPNVGDDTVTEDKGLGDPALSARWRLMDQASSPFILDFVPRLSHSRGKFRAGTPSKEGNNESGRSIYGFRFEAGKKYTKLQWMTYLGYSQASKAKGEDEIERSSSSQIVSGIKILSPIESGFYAFGGLHYAREGAYELSDDQGFGIKYPTITKGTVEGGLTYTPYINFALSGSFQLGKISDHTRKDFTGAKVKYDNGSISVVSLLARYQF